MLCIDVITDGQWYTREVRTSYACQVRKDIRSLWLHFKASIGSRWAMGEIFFVDGQLDRTRTFESSVSIFIHWLKIE